MRKAAATIALLLSLVQVAGCDEPARDDYDLPAPAPGLAVVSYYSDGFSYENTDGSLSVGAIHCDGNNRYLRGGTAAENDWARKTLDESIDKAKQEVKDIDKALEQCKGPGRRDRAYYDATAGCNREELANLKSAYDAAEEEVRDAEMQVAYGPGRVRGAEARVKQLEDNLKREREQTTNPLVMGVDAIYTGTTGLEAPSMSQDKIGLEHELEQATKAAEQAVKSMRLYNAELPEVRRQAQQVAKAFKDSAAKCAAADRAAQTDPCGNMDIDRLNTRRAEAIAAVGRWQSHRDRLKKCIETQAKSSKPVLQPGDVMGIIGGMRPAPRAKTPPQTPAPSHGHKE